MLFAPFSRALLLQRALTVLHGPGITAQNAMLGEARSKNVEKSVLGCGRDLGRERVRQAAASGQQKRTASP